MDGTDGSDELTKEQPELSGNGRTAFVECALPKRDAVKCFYVARHGIYESLIEPLCLLDVHECEMGANLTTTSVNHLPDFE
jgi:hypothetical protein